MSISITGDYEIERRKNLPIERRFTNSQEYHIKDYSEQKFTLDRTSAFSVRPPELVPFNELIKFTKYFTRVPVPKRKPDEVYDVDHVNCVPICDGSGAKVQFVQRYLCEAREYLENKLERCTSFPNDENLDRGQVFVGRQVLQEILIPLTNMTEDEQKTSPLGKMFIDFSCSKPITVVCTPISPYSSMFAYSRILRNGKFTCEMDIFNEGDIRSAFKSLKLVKDYTQSDVDQMLSKYWMEELLYLPIRRRTVAKYLHESARVLENLIVNGENIGTSVPFVLLNQIDLNYTEEFNALMEERRDVLINVLSSSKIPHFPNIDSLRRKQAIVWDPRLPNPSPDQSIESWEEQNRIISHCQQILQKLFARDRYVHPGSAILLGPPGSGKSFVNNIIATYALSLGLNICFSALTAQRARELGGLHLHQLFCLQVREGVTDNTDLQSESSVMKLILSDPLKKEYLRKIDILFIDEIGLLNKQTLATIDNILKTIRKSSCVFGGMVIFATGDYCQLDPPSGIDMWSSFYTLASFDIFRMKHLVRSHRDKDLQRIIEILRQSEISKDDKEFVVSIFQRRFSQGLNIVETFDKAPLNFVKLIPRKKGVQEVSEIVNDERERITIAHNMECDPTEKISCAKFISIDEMESSLGVHMLATPKVSKSLTYDIREPQSLFVTEGQLLRFTVNSKNYTQGQVCKVKEIIYSDNVHAAVDVVIAKPGTREFDESCKVLRVKPIYTRWVNLRHPKVRARRKQLPLVTEDCNTIHKALGQTHDGVTTKMSTTDKNYNIWERSMFLVIVSRVRCLDNLVFVGEAHDTLECIRSILNMKCPKWQFIENLSDRKDNHDDIIPYELFNLHQDDFYLPGAHAVGYLYILISLVNKNRRYVGLTFDLRKEVADINIGLKSINRPTALKPWVCMGFMAGFPVKKCSSMSLLEQNCESVLHQDIMTMNENHHSDVFYKRVNDLVTEWNSKEDKTFTAKMVWACSENWFGYDPSMPIIHPIIHP